jgi:hypothetical protein
MAWSESLYKAHERVMHEAVKVKPKLQWRSQDVGDAGNVDHLPRKSTARNGASPGERPCGLQTARPWAV